MPAFHAGAHDMAGARGDAPDAAFIDILAGELMRTAKEGIRSAADGEVFRLGKRPEFLTLFQGKHQRLFGIDVLAGFQNGFRHREMRGRNGKVDDDIKLVIRQKLLDGLRLHTIFFGAQLGRFGVDVRTGQHLQSLEERRQRQVGGGNIARIR